MKAQLLQSYGETPDFRLADVETPVAGPGRVLVRVAATSVNPIDIKIRTMRPAFAPALPAILGMDVAGVVEAVGEGVGAFKPGDEVFGCAGGLSDMPGALAQFMSADEVVFYRDEQPADYVARLTDGRGFDVVFDTVGGPNLDASFLAAAQGGTVVSTNTRSTHDLSTMHAKALTLSVVFMLLPLITGRGRSRHGEIMREVARLAAEGRLRPHLGRVHPWTDIAQAHDCVSSGRAVGKVVLQVG